MRLKNRFKNVSLWLFLTFILAAVTPAVLWVDRTTMFEIWDAIGVGLAVAAFIRWGPAAWEAIKPPIHDLFAWDYLVLGLGFVFIGGTGRLGIQWYWRASDQTNGLINSASLLYCTIFTAIGFFLLLIPTYSAETGRLSIQAWPVTVVLTLLSFAIGGSLIYLGWG